jgi:hypothetical protein
VNPSHAAHPSAVTAIRPDDHQSATQPTATAPADADELHRLCVFELDLTCGHCVTVSLNGWYPVSVACCDRLGGAWYDGIYYPFSSDVDYVRLLVERYEHRPAGAHREPLRVLNRRARTDDAVIPIHSWQRGSAGRFPAWVGGPVPDQRAAARS